MATKRVDEKLRCAKCKRDGTATWEVAEGRGWPSRNAPTLIGLTAGFKSIDKGGRDGPIVKCASCGAIVAPL
jgi:hypothetical protein